MTEHLPECPVIALLIKGNTVAAGSCICSRLRACEERVLAGDERWIRASTEANHRIAYRLGHDAALDAAREAIAEQKLVPLAKQGRFIITRNTKLWEQRQAWSELGWWDFRTSALSAIDALRKDER